jgi:endonuclease YncB( thermonuclease family)
MLFEIKKKQEEKEKIRLKSIHAVERKNIQGELFSSSARYT